MKTAGAADRCACCSSSSRARRPRPCPPSSATWGRTDFGPTSRGGRWRGREPRPAGGGGRASSGLCSGTPGFTCHASQTEQFKERCCDPPSEPRGSVASGGAVSRARRPSGGAGRCLQSYAICTFAGKTAAKKAAAVDADPVNPTADSGSAANWYARHLRLRGRMSLDQIEAAASAVLRGDSDRASMVKQGRAGSLRPCPRALPARCAARSICRCSTSRRRHGRGPARSRR